jgi:hypothetical protein
LGFFLWRFAPYFHQLLLQLSSFAMSYRHFPPPWSVEELDACFVIKDDAGQKLAYVYFEEEPESLIDFFV